MTTTRIDYESDLPARLRLKGPPEVRPWHTLRPKRDGSPCVLRRKFGYVRTRHATLGKLEAAMRVAQKEQSAQPEEKRDSYKLKSLQARIDNAREWLNFSVKTLEEHCKFACSRFDGSLDEKTGRQSIYSRSTANASRRERHKKTQDLVNYYLQELPTYIACCAVAANTVGRDAAMERLIEVARPVVEHVKKTSGIEPEDAEARAWQYLWEKTAHKFDPASEKSNMARFTTYFAMHAKRATQKRTKADAGIGEHRVPGSRGEQDRYIRVSSICSSDETDHSSDAFHPGTYDVDIVTRTAVAQALARLDEDERRFAIMRFVENTSLRTIADDYGVGFSVVRRLDKELRAKLRDFLGDFQVD